MVAFARDLLLTLYQTDPGQSPPKTEPRVTSWVETTDEQLFHLSVLTLGEIRKGIASVENRQRRVTLEAWLASDLLMRFAGRILVIDQEVADRWGFMVAQAAAANLVIPVIDGLLAATAMHHNLTFVTRNTKDVAMTGVAVFNPWLQ